VLLIPRRSASSFMPPIGTSGVGLTCNTELIASLVTFRSMLESTIEASEAALIGDTRQKELFINFTFNKRRVISNLSIPTNVSFEKDLS